MVKPPLTDGEHPLSKILNKPNSAVSSATVFFHPFSGINLALVKIGGLSVGGLYGAVRTPEIESFLIQYVNKAHLVLLHIFCFFVKSVKM